MTKVCKGCGEIKPIDQFYRNKGTRDGRQGKCKPCTNRMVNQSPCRSTPEYHAAAKEWRRKWRLSNPDKVAATKRRYMAKNKEAVAAQQKQWQQANPAKVYARWSKQRATKRNATPLWADAAALAKIYEQAAQMRAAGHDVHVDHIIPLQGRTVCGLHVAHNLQIVPATYNLRKNARLDGIPYEHRW